MRSKIENIMELLEGSKQFVVPIYQRRYTWGREQCQELWSDIENIGVAQGNEFHFFGPIVCMEPEAQSIGGVRQVLVIDGQQRLATISLLIAALCEAINNEKVPFGVTSREMSNLYLFNDRKEGKSHYKQILTQSDTETLKCILDGRDLPSDVSENLVRNHSFFRSKLKGARLEVIYEGLQRLQVVEITLERERDNPQMIFEGLNAKGVELSPSDLIRNYVLMGRELDFQTKLYNTYWYPMEQRFRGKNAKHFSSFIRHYLILKTKRVCFPKDIYRRFKELVERDISPETLEQNLEEISLYSKHYLNVVLHKESNEELLRCFKDFSQLDTDAAYPFLLKVYDCYQKGELKIDEVKETVSLVESYILRRLICDIPIRNMFRYLLELFDIMDSEGWIDNYLELLYEKFQDFHSAMRFPRDTDFKRMFMDIEIYDFKHLMYILRKMEEYSGNPVNTSELSIERVMPEKLTSEWREELGPSYEQDHERYLNRIGNITLTDANSELSNRSFTEKKTMQPYGFLYSPLYLNKALRETDTWNLVSIQRRASELSDTAAKVWIYPYPRGQ